MNTVMIRRSDPCPRGFLAQSNTVGMAYPTHRIAMLVTGRNQIRVTTEELKGPQSEP